MLSNQAQIFYYANRSIIVSWSDFKTSMRKLFENFEWNQMNLIKWQIINLFDTISANSILSTTKCFRKLITEMNILQRDIDSQFEEQFYFRKNIIQIVRDHSAFLIELINSVNNVINLISNLQNSIINYEAMHRPSTHKNYVQFYKNEKMEKNEIENEAYYIDRSYKKRKLKMRDRDRFFCPCNMASRRLFKSNSSRQKKCFVCEKIGCWSINHTSQKKSDFIKKFENRNFSLRIKSDFNKNVQQWIIKYENKNVDEIIQFFNQLIIDFETYNTKSDWLENIESNEQFFISYETLENIELWIIIEQFANNFFLHRASKRDEIISSIFSILYVYNVVIKSWYESIEFKNIFINLKAAVKSNKKFRQFNTLQRFDDSIKLDHNTTKSANFVFEMKHTISVDSIKLDTFMKLVIFHIMTANIFFLCLIDINKLETFFNSITNQMIQFERLFSVIRCYDHFFYYDTYAHTISSSIFWTSIFVFWLKSSCIVYIVDSNIFRFVNFKIFSIGSIMTLIYIYFMNSLNIVINVKNMIVFQNDSVSSSKTTLISIST